MHGLQLRFESANITVEDLASSQIRYGITVAQVSNPDHQQSLKPTANTIWDANRLQDWPNRKSAIPQLWVLRVTSRPKMLAHYSPC